MYWIRQSTVNAGSAQGKTLVCLSTSAGKGILGRQGNCHASKCSFTVKIDTYGERGTNRHWRAAGRQPCVDHTLRHGGVTPNPSPLLRSLYFFMPVNQRTRFAANWYTSSVFASMVDFSNGFAPGIGRGTCWRIDVTASVRASRFPDSTAPTGN